MRVFVECVCEVVCEKVLNEIVYGTFLLHTLVRDSIGNHSYLESPI